MIKKALFLFLLGALCVGTALAGTQRQVIYKLDGKIPGVNFSAALPGVTGGYINFDLYAFPLPVSGFGYEADITWNDGSFHQIRGYVPANVIKGGVGGPLTVNIADATYDIEPNSPIEDDPAFISIEGTFTPYTGVDSHAYSETGKKYDTTTYPDGSTETSGFNGTAKNESATFEGTFVVSSGTYHLSVAGPSDDARIALNAGTYTDIITTP